MPTNTSRAAGNLKSITAMVIAVGCFSLMDTVLKLLSARYPALQIAALRGLCGLPLILVFITARGAWGTVWRVRCICCAARSASRCSRCSPPGCASCRCPPPTRCFSSRRC
jgi:hypothetical protein